MKIIFLDVDGVLNSNLFLSSCKGNEEVDDDKIEKLKKIQSATGAEIVLTSTWKIYLNRDLSAHHEKGNYLIKKLASHNLYLFAVTEDSGMDRGEGIINFLADYPDASFVILDDEIFDDYYEYDLLSKLVLTDFYGNPGGLTDEDVEKAIRILES